MKERTCYNCANYLDKAPNNYEYQVASPDHDPDRFCWTDREDKGCCECCIVEN